MWIGVLMRFADNLLLVIRCLLLLLFNIFLYILDYCFSLFSNCLGLLKQSFLRRAKLPAHVCAVLFTLLPMVILQCLTSFLFYVSLPLF